MERMIDLLISLYGPTPYLLIFVILLVCGLGLPIPEDVTLFAAGVSAYYGVTHLWGLIVVCYVGVMLGEPATPPQTFSGSTYSMPSLPLGDRLSCSVKFVVPSLHLKGPIR